MWIFLIILAATFAAFRFLYTRSVSQGIASEKLGERGISYCTRYRLAAAAALAAHAAVFFALIGRPKMGGWVHSLPWGGPLWLVLGIILMPFALYFLLAGLAAAGRRTFAATGSEELFGGVYRELRHPQFLGLFLFLLSAALMASSPLLAAVSLAWLWQFLGLIRIEDADLWRRMGPAYAEYRKRTGAFMTLKAPPGSRRLDHCLNCGTELAGPYCHRCGQRGVDANRSLRALAADYVRHELRRNPRFLRTLLALVFKPGFLSLEFLAGRRARYLSPLRTYLAASVLAFFLLALAGQRMTGRRLTDVLEPEPTKGGEAGGSMTMDFLRGHLGDQALLARAERDPKLRDSLAASALREEYGEHPAMLWASGSPGARDSLMSELERSAIWIGDVPLDLGDSAKAQGKASGSAGSGSRFGRAVLRGWEKARSDPGRLAEAAVRRIPQAMFLLMPLFALFLKLLYLRHRRFYVQHLVFALHFHSAAFMAVSAITALNLWAPAAGGYGNLLALTVPLHLLLGMKRFYGQGWPKTALKFMLVSSAYMAASIVVLSLAFLLSLASL